MQGIWKSIDNECYWQDMVIYEGSHLAWPSTKAKLLEHGFEWSHQLDQKEGDRWCYWKMRKGCCHIVIATLFEIVEALQVNLLIPAWIMEWVIKGYVSSCVHFCLTFEPLWHSLDILHTWCMYKVILYYARFVSV